MNQITQHLPGYVDTGEPKSAEFSTLGELLCVPFVSRWAATPSFTRFSLSDGLLMAEINHNQSWYVVGHIQNPQELDLPAWEHPRGI